MIGFIRSRLTAIDWSVSGRDPPYPQFLPPLYGHSAMPSSRAILTTTWTSSVVPGVTTAAGVASVHDVSRERRGASSRGAITSGPPGAWASRPSARGGSEDPGRAGSGVVGGVG